MSFKHGRVGKDLPERHSGLLLGYWNYLRHGGCCEWLLVVATIRSETFDVDCCVMPWENQQVGV